MRRLNSEARLLDAMDLHDVDRIVTFLTPRTGQKRGVAKGARRKFSRFAGQLELLSRVAVSWFEKDNRELVRIESVESISSPSTLLGDLEGILVASYLADHLVQFTQENEESDLFVRLLESTIAFLEAGGSRALALRFFEAWVLRIAGIFPAPDDCPFCGRDLFAAGAVLSSSGEGIVCRGCESVGGGAVAVSPDALGFLAATAGSSLTTLSRREIAPSTLRCVEDVCARVRRSFLNHELRSYEVMKSTIGHGVEARGVG